MWWVDGEDRHVRTHHLLSTYRVYKEFRTVETTASQNLEYLGEKTNVVDRLGEFYVTKMSWAGGHVPCTCLTT